jgi:hypothetical protein
MTRYCQVEPPEGGAAAVGHRFQRPGQLAAGIRVVDASDEQGQARPGAILARAVVTVVVWGETESDVDGEPADETLGDDLSLVLVQVASGKGL